MPCVTGLSGQGRPAISVSPETIVQSDRVELGKIASITGAGDRSERLKNISLGYAPNFGMTREIARDQIALAINAAGFVNGEFTLVTPQRVTVHRVGLLIPDEQIRAEVERAVTERFATDRVSMRIVQIDLPQKIEVPVGTVDIRASVTGIRTLFERFSTPVEIRVDGKLVRSFAANVGVEAFADVFVAVKDLTANAKIGEADVRLEKRKIERPITNYFRETANLRGLRVVKNIANGEALRSDTCVSSVVIQSGDPVRVEAQSGKMKIILAGEARTSGRIGDRISVKNTQSGAILQAIVIDAGQAKVIL